MSASRKPNSARSPDGFVALGGPYADHEDPVIAGISKVIRNTPDPAAFRNHAGRPISTAASRAAVPLRLVCSVAVRAGLPYIRDFFAEKLNIPIDHFQRASQRRTRPRCQRRGDLRPKRTAWERWLAALCAMRVVHRSNSI